MAATIVVDLGFGDAGKGSIVDFLSRRKNRPSVVVRFNGGGQAAHNVITPSGIHHTFAQFGSATYATGAQTFLSRFMLVDPLTLRNEADHLRATGCGYPFHGLYVDEDAIVVTPYHKLVNRAREFARINRHGSCGMGIGETMRRHESNPEQTIRMRDLIEPHRLLHQYRDIREWANDSYPEIKSQFSLRNMMDMIDGMRDVARQCTVVPGHHLKQLAERNDLLFEGAQGVLLDETFGFHPHTTWSTCTFGNAQTLLDEISYAESVDRLGVLRAYMVRHGPGPFPTENVDLTALLPERHNGLNDWQGAFRAGWFDAVLARYAIEVCGGVDTLAITNIDILGRVRDYPLRVASHYTYQGSSSPLARLVPVREPSLHAQSALGHFLSNGVPVYRTNADMMEHLDLIRDELNVPISIELYGTDRDG